MKNTFLKFYWILNYPNSYKTHKYRYGHSIEDEEIIDEHEVLSNAIIDASLNYGIGKSFVFVNDLFIFSGMAMMIFISFLAVWIIENSVRSELYWPNQPFDTR